jgi:hypothetical protein
VILVATDSPAGPERALRAAVTAAAAVSGGLIGVQMGGKALRDALFLSTYEPAALPTMVIASAVVALLLVLVASRILPTVTPGRLLPRACLLSAGLLLVEWALLGPSRRAAAVLYYLHYGGFGALLISAFWSLVSERFDPRSAKRHIGRIAAAGTVGGLVGGLAAERVAAWASIGVMFPVLAAVQVACALAVRPLRPLPAPGAAARPAAAAPSAFRILTDTPYLRGLVTVVVLVTLSEGLIDFVFKASAAAVTGRGEQLLRLFAAFYTLVGVASAAVQAAASRRALERLGLAQTVAVMPGVVALGGAGVLFLPGLVPAAALRGVEAVLRNSLYRAGYELLFTPLPPSEKRATKTLIDVGAVRLGDIAGAGMVQMLLLVAGMGAQRVMLALGAALAAGATWVALRLHRGYVAALERSLVAQAIHLDPEDATDLTTRTAILQSGVTLGLMRPAFGEDAGGPALLGAVSPGAPAPPPRPVTPPDPVTARVADLRAPDAATVRAALRTGPWSPELAGHVIPLLARDDLLRDVLTALREAAPRVTGQLVDRLLDPDEEFTVRRRLPLVLGASPTDRAVDGLLRGLGDPRFEVRYRCGRALVRVLDLAPGLTVSGAAIEAAILDEVTVDRGLWEGRRLLDRLEDDAWSPLVDEVLRDRANRSLEHVFTLLSLILPRQPLVIAFRGLHTTDPMLRGTALEYLETALPEAIRIRLWPYLEDGRSRRGATGGPTAGRPAAQVLEDLLRSRQSIAINLEELRRRRSGEA